MGHHIGEVVCMKLSSQLQREQKAEQVYQEVLEQWILRFHDFTLPVLL